MIAELRAKTGADQAAVASAVVTALNESARKDALITELTACLEMCLDADASPQSIKRTNKSNSSLKL